MPWRQSDKPSGMERLISALCYLTGGIAGIIYIIISRSNYQAPFFRFHFLQSIVLVLLAMLMNWASGAMSLILQPLVPWIADLLSTVLPAQVVGNLLVAFAMLFAAVLQAFSLLSVYGLIWAALGKYAEIPFISNVVRQQMR